jgi:hypothetical protein
MRFEVTEEPSPGQDGARWVHTPELGIFHATIDVCGYTLVPEDRIRAALEVGAQDPERMVDELHLALGSRDDELERSGTPSEGAPVRWLHRVG